MYPVTDAQIRRKLVAALVVEDVGAVTRWASQDHWFQPPGPARRPDAVPDRLFERLGKSVEHADIQVDPASLVISGAARDQYDLRLDQAGLADQVTSGFDQDLSGETTAQV